MSRKIRKPNAPTAQSIERAAMVRQRLAGGDSISDIAADLNISHSALSQWCRARKIHRPIEHRGGHNKMKPSAIGSRYQIVTDGLKDSKTLTAIAEEIGITVSALSVWLKRVGLR